MDISTLVVSAIIGFTLAYFIFEVKICKKSDENNKRTIEQSNDTILLLKEIDSVRNILTQGSCEVTFHLPSKTRKILHYTGRKTKFRK